MALTIDLSGRCALVTGAASGLGEGSAMALARAGADIAIADVDQENSQRVAKAVEALGRKAFFVMTDMMDHEQIKQMVVAVKEHFGAIDILVNNVGGVRQMPFLKQSANSIDRHIDLNLKSTLLTTQAVAPIMIEGQRGGSIINVASTEALRAAPGFAVYAACKAGITNFTRTMALELSAHDIHSHALAPDMIITPGLKPLLNAETEKEKAARDRYVPLKRMGTIEEFGNLVAFLASDMASYLNGLTIPVDAGITAAAGWFRAPDDEWCLYHGQ